MLMRVVLLLAVAAEIQLAFIFNEAESHLIQPTASAEYIPSESLMRREIDRDIK